MRALVHEKYQIKVLKHERFIKQPQERTARSDISLFYNQSINIIIRTLYNLIRDQNLLNKLKKQELFFSIDNLHFPNTFQEICVVDWKVSIYDNLFIQRQKVISGNGHKL